MQLKYLKMQNSFFLILFSLLIFSCKNKNSIKNIEILKAQEVIGSDSLGSVDDLVLVKDKIVVLDDKPIFDENQLRVYNKYNYRFVSSLGRKGLGPGEFHQGMSLNNVYYKDDTFTLLDLTTKKVIFFSEDENGKMKYKHSITLKGGRAYMPVALNDNTIYSLCLEIFEGRFAHYDSLGNMLETLGEIPPGKKDETPVPAHQQASKGLIKLTPDQSKLVISYQFADMIDIYDLSGNLLNRIIGDLGKTPIYKTEIRDGYPTMLIDFKEAIFGFLDIEVSDKYIIALYSGKIIGESKYESDVIHIYTYNGKLKDIIKLDTYVSQIALDIENESLLACTSNPLPKILSFHLKLE